MRRECTKTKNTPPLSGGFEAALPREKGRRERSVGLEHITFPSNVPTSGNTGSLSQYEATLAEQATRKGTTALHCPLGDRAPSGTDRSGTSEMLLLAVDGRVMPARLPHGVELGRRGPARSDRGDRLVRDCPFHDVRQHLDDAWPPDRDVPQRSCDGRPFVA